MSGIFISYAHIDNEPLVEGAPGWISNLHRVLEKRLAMLLGERPEIWRDRELRGHDLFDQTIAEHIEKAAVFVSVLTPRYIRSDYCRKELETFFGTRRGLVLGDKARIFKVIKTPIEIGEHPERIRNLLGYEFFQIEEDRRRMRELSLDAPDPDYRARFLTIADDLAQDIGSLLRLAESMPAGAASAAPAATPGKKRSVVYLAATTSDLKEAHDQIRRELVAEEHLVLPAAVLPVEGEGFNSAVAEHLTEAALSVHLIGARYGFVPEDANASNVELQLGLAAGRRPALPRLIWMPPDLATEDPRQLAVIEKLRSDPAAQQGAALLATSLEELKAEIRRRLAPAPPPAAAPAADLDEGPPWIYLIHDPRDEGELFALEDHLWSSGFEVKKPLADGDETELREEHEENLRLCDGFLIYYGNGNERWLSKNLADLKKARGLGREKPILAKAIYVAPPEAPAKARYRTLEATVIQGGAAFDPAQLSPFLAPFAGRGGAS